MKKQRSAIKDDAASIAEQSVDLEDVITTSSLYERPYRAPNFEAENKALASLAEVMANAPDTIFQKLADNALALCNAHSAGISIVENDKGNVIFRWRATAGKLFKFLGGTMPRHFSPCGIVLDQNAPVLMTDMVRYYDYVSELNIPVCEALLLPFHLKGVPIGTVWIVAHDANKHFDLEDLRILQSLTKVASLAVKIVTKTQNLEISNELAVQQQAHLKRADRSKDEFLATLAHELRNPLAPLSNALSVIKLADDKPQLRASAYKTMERQLSQIVRLVDDLLDVSRITRNTIELRRERILLADVIKSAVETSHPLIAAARHHFSLSIPPENIYLDGDFTRITQIFANLINNAVKYTPKGGEISLRAEVQDGVLKVFLRDNGIGIDKTKLPHIFDIFNQVDNSVERSHGGLGIGLALVKNLLHHHGGTIIAKSEGLGKGSEFIFTLPTTGEPTQTIELQNEEEKTSHTPSLRILVVDDNIPSAKTMGWMLELMGHEIELVHDGAEVLTAAQKFKPDVILLDIGLPGKNGYEVCRELKAHPGFEHVTLIAQTGWAQEKDKKLAKDAGFTDHLVKPVDIEALKRALARRS